MLTRPTELPSNLLHLEPPKAVKLKKVKESDQLTAQLRPSHQEHAQETVGPMFDFTPQNHTTRHRAGENTPRNL